MVKYSQVHPIKGAPHSARDKLKRDAFFKSALVMLLLPLLPLLPHSNATLTPI